MRLSSRARSIWNFLLFLHIFVRKNMRAGLVAVMRPHYMRNFSLGRFVTRRGREQKFKCSALHVPRPLVIFIVFGAACKKAFGQNRKKKFVSRQRWVRFKIYNFVQRYFFRPLRETATKTKKRPNENSEFRLLPPKKVIQMQAKFFVVYDLILAHPFGTEGSNNKTISGRTFIVIYMKEMTLYIFCKLNKAFKSFDRMHDIRLSGESNFVSNEKKSCLSWALIENVLLCFTKFRKIKFIFLRKKISYSVSTTSKSTITSNFICFAR